MSRFLLISILVTAFFLIIACIFSPTATPGAAGILSTLRLTTHAEPGSFTAADQIVGYTYTVAYSGDTPLDGPVKIVDSKAIALCPELTTIGNKNNKLEINETITCAAAYKTTAADVTAGVITSTATAQVGGQSSNTVTTNVNLAGNKQLIISVTANPNSFNQVDQVIKYTYVIKNAGPNTLGPAQFVITDQKISPNPINCQGGNTLLAANESVSCDVDYKVIQADVDAKQITNNATAIGGGASTIQPATLTINFGNAPAPAPGGTSNIPRGSTFSHPVKSGEWMLQIARCYGADFDTVRRANPQIIDPDFITIFDTISVPNVGSVGPIYGEPCITTYTVKSGDTWTSIANNPQFNAAIDVLMEANKDVTFAPGQTIVIPLNSKGYGSGTVPNPPAPTGRTIRLTFSGSAPTIARDDTIGTTETVHYVFTAAAGQALNVKLTVPSNDIKLAIYGPGNAVVKALDNTTTWNGTLNANGDYTIDLVSTSGTANRAYHIEVTLTTPTPSLFERVADINNGPGDSLPSYMSVFNGQLFFQANGNDGTGTELWKYDAAQRAASRVADINAGSGGSDPAYLVPFGNMLYFSANGNDGGGRELWRFNGTAAGRVTDLNTGTGDSNPMYLTVFNNVLYFSAKGSDNMGNELWKFDGTTPTRVTDINPGSGDSNPAYLAVFNGALYFSAVGPNSAGTELWKYDGTNATMAADINNGLNSSSPAFLTVFNNALYFSANGGDGNGTELWKFDGNTATRAADINPGPGDSIPTYLTVFNNNLYFSANADSAGFEIWKFDGSKASRVSDLNPAGNANPAFLTPFNNELYFQANANDGAGAELWKYKGQ